MVLVRWGVTYGRRQGMQRIEYRYKCPTVVRGRQSSPTTLDLESNPPTGVFGSLFWPLIPAKTWFMTQNRIDGAAVIGQLDGCMSAPFQTCGVPLLLFVWPLHWTGRLTRVDLMITRTTTKQQHKNNKYPTLTSLWIWNQKRGGTTRVWWKRVNISEFMATIIMVDSGTRPSVVGQWANTYCIGVAYSENLLEGLVRPLYQCWNIVFNQPAVATDWVTKP